MRIINAKVYGTDYRFHDGSAAMENGVFTEVLTGEMADAGEKVAFGEMAGTGEEVIDAQGKYLIPGLTGVLIGFWLAGKIVGKIDKPKLTKLVYTAVGISGFLYLLGL